MIINVSWKNVWRSKQRSVIIMTAITLGIFAGLFLIAFSKGMTEQRISSSLKTEVSHIQIHNEGYLENNDFNLYIENIDSLSKLLETDHRVQGFSKRIVINSLASTAETGAGVKITGVNPEIETFVTDLNTKVIEGQYFNGVKRKPIVIGQKLAKKLKAKVRSKIVLQLQDTAGQTFPAAFRVVGIYKTTNTAFDEMNVFVRNTDIYNLCGLNASNAHEISIFLNDRDEVNNLDMELERKFPDLEINTWEEGNIMLGYLNDAMDQYMIIFILIILFALYFGIANTMLMAILERRKEIGMLMAIGMKKFKVFRMIMYETIFLSLVGAILGIILGILSVYYFGKKGLDLSIWGTGLEAYGYDPIIYLSLDTGYIIQVVLWVVFTGVLASLLPAWKALRLNPCEALRTD